MASPNPRGNPNAYSNDYDEDDASSLDPDESLLVSPPPAEQRLHRTPRQQRDDVDGSSRDLGSGDVEERESAESLVARQVPVNTPISNENSDAEPSSDMISPLVTATFNYADALEELEQLAPSGTKAPRPPSQSPLPDPSVLPYSEDQHEDQLEDEQYTEASSVFRYPCIRSENNNEDSDLELKLGRPVNDSLEESSLGGVHVAESKCGERDEILAGKGSGLNEETDERKLESVESEGKGGDVLDETSDTAIDMSSVSTESFESNAGEKNCERAGSDNVSSFHEYATITSSCEKKEDIESMPSVQSECIKSDYPTLGSIETTTPEKECASSLVPVREKRINIDDNNPSLFEPSSSSKDDQLDEVINPQSNNLAEGKTHDGTGASSSPLLPIKVSRASEFSLAQESSQISSARGGSGGHAQAVSLAFNETIPTAKVANASKAPPIDDNIDQNTSKEQVALPVALKEIFSGSGAPKTFSSKAKNESEFDNMPDSLDASKGILSKDAQNIKPSILTNKPTLESRRDADFLCLNSLAEEEAASGNRFGKSRHLKGPLDDDPCKTSCDSKPGLDACGRNHSFNSPEFKSPTHLPMGNKDHLLTSLSEALSPISQISSPQRFECPADSTNYTTCERQFGLDKRLKADEYTGISGSLRSSRKTTLENEDASPKRLKTVSIKDSENDLARSSDNDATNMSSSVQGAKLDSSDEDKTVPFLPPTGDYSTKTQLGSFNKENDTPRLEMSIEFTGKGRAREALDVETNSKVSISSGLAEDEEKREHLDDLTGFQTTFNNRSNEFMSRLKGAAENRKREVTRSRDSLERKVKILLDEKEDRSSVAAMPTVKEAHNLTTPVPPCQKKKFDGVDPFKPFKARPWPPPPASLAKKENSKSRHSTTTNITRLPQRKQSARQPASGLKAHASNAKTCAPIEKAAKRMSFEPGEDPFIPFKARAMPTSARQITDASRLKRKNESSPIKDKSNLQHYIEPPARTPLHMTQRKQSVKTSALKAKPFKRVLSGAQASLDKEMKQRTKLQAEEAKLRRQSTFKARPLPPTITRVPESPPIDDLVGEQLLPDVSSRAVKGGGKENVVNKSEPQKRESISKKRHSVSGPFIPRSTERAKERSSFDAEKAEREKAKKEGQIKQRKALIDKTTAEAEDLKKKLI